MMHIPVEGGPTDSPPFKRVENIRKTPLWLRFTGHSNNKLITHVYLMAYGLTCYLSLVCTVVAVTLCNVILNGTMLKLFCTVMLLIWMTSC